jgi:hypothetical protein
MRELPGSELRGLRGQGQLNPGVRYRSLNTRTVFPGPRARTK